LNSKTDIDTVQAEQRRDKSDKGTVVLMNAKRKYKSRAVSMRAYNW